MAALTETAFAKINLALHVTGQRADGYHLLDTLVTFSESGDILRFEAADEDEFTLSGPHAASLGDEPRSANLVLKARDALRLWMQAQGFEAPPVRIHLEKHLPVASGIGGGSADAAAAFRGLCRLWAVNPSTDVLQRLALPLGADVPMCLLSRPLIARGIGDEITSIALPSLFLLLVNPLVPVSTPEIFRRLTQKTNPPMPSGLEDLQTDTLAHLAPLRNDLQPPAEELQPVISGLIGEITDSGARIARMSGSGATCFGLYDGAEALDRALLTLRQDHPAWFVSASRTLG